MKKSALMQGISSRSGNVGTKLLLSSTVFDGSETTLSEIQQQSTPAMLVKYCAAPLGHDDIPVTI